MCSRYKCDGVRDLESEVFVDVEYLMRKLDSINRQIGKENPDVYEVLPQRVLDDLDSIEARLRTLRAMVAPYHREEKKAARHSVDNP